MIDISLSRDPETGLISGKIVPKNNLLESYFETEVQNDLALIGYVETLAAQDGPVEIIGNAHTLKFNDDRYTVTSLFDEAAPPTTGTKTEFLFLLSQWRDFLRREIDEN